MNRIALIFALGILLFGFQKIAGQESIILKTIPLGVLNEKAKYLPLPKLPNIQARVAGQVSVVVKIDLSNGKVVSAEAVSGHPLLRSAAVAASREAGFEPILKDFGTLYGDGVLVYKVEDFNGKTLINPNPKSLFPLVGTRTSIINGKAINLEKPVYSKEARVACAKGKVEVLTLIHNWRGEVVAAKAISGDELLFEEAEKAVLKSKFASANINGNNDFYVIGKIVYNFDSFAKCLNLGVVNKKALDIPRPQVPNFNQPKHLQIKKDEKVTVKIVIDLNGQVIYAKAVSGHPLLRTACEASARKTKFSPTIYNGPPFYINALLVYKFKPDGTIEF